MNKPISLLFVFIALILLSLGVSAPALSQHAPPPSVEHLTAFATLKSGRTVQVDESNIYFLYGVVSKFQKLCPWPYADTKNDVNTFISRVEKASAQNAFGRSGQNMFTGPILTAQEIQQGADTINAHVSEHGCAASSLTRSMEQVVLGKHQKGELRTWVKTCMEAKMTQAMCQCIGDVGETVQPGALDMPYSIDVFDAWLHRNPMLAYTLPTLCNLR